MEDNIRKEEINNLNYILENIRNIKAKNETRIKKLEEEANSDVFGYEDRDRVVDARDALKTKKNKQKKYEEIEKVPYFVRVRTFIKDSNNNEEVQDFYIGKNGYFPRENRTGDNKIRIYDWKDKEADLFYNNDDQFSEKEAIKRIDNKEYRLDLVRKFNIENGILYNYYTTYSHGESIFENGQMDPYFIQILNKKRSEGELSDIISTIQSEQNKIIRKDVNKNFIVQGCAGSGKTLIMLHRLAYLDGNSQLERFHPVYILTPNSQFKQYIASVQQSLDLDSDKITTLSLEEYYLMLIRQYFKGIRQNFEFSYADKQERILDQNFLRHVYSMEFSRQVESEIYRLWDEMEDAYPLPFEIFDHPYSKGRETLKFIKSSYLRIETEHSGEIRKLNDLEKKLDKVRQKNSVLIAEETELSESFTEHLNNLRTAIENGDNKELKICFKKDQKILKKRLNRLNRVLSGILSRNKDLKQDGYSTDDLKRFSQEFKEQISELMILDAEDPLTVKDDDSKHIRELKSNIESNPFFRFIDEYLANYRMVSKIEKRVQLLDDLQKDKELSNRFNEEDLKQIVGIIKDYEMDGWQITAASDLSLSSAVIYIDHGREILDQIDSNRHELMEIFKDYSNCCNDLFGCVFSLKTLQKNLSEIESFWSWDNLFQILIKDHLPNEWKSTVTDLKMDYRYNLYLVLLLASLYYPSLNMEDSMLNIDEAQDISVAEFQLMKNIHTSECKFNLYGDIQQNVYDYRGVSSWDKTVNIMPMEIYSLKQNYRNPSQITEYCNKQFDTDNAAIGEGTAEVMQVDDLDYVLNYFVRLFQENPLEHFAIIYKDENLAKFVQKRLKDDNPRLFEQSEPFAFFGVHEAKGLEFQYVLSLTSLMSENEMYVSFTRALKRLIVCNYNLNSESFETLQSEEWNWPEYKEQYLEAADENEFTLEAILANSIQVNEETNLDNEIEEELLNEEYEDSSLMIRLKENSEGLALGLSKEITDKEVKTSSSETQIEQSIDEFKKNGSDKDEGSVSDASVIMDNSEYFDESILDNLKVTFGFNQSLYEHVSALEDINHAASSESKDVSHEEIRISISDETSEESDPDTSDVGPLFLNEHTLTSEQENQIESVSLDSIERSSIIDEPVQVTDVVDMDSDLEASTDSIEDQIFPSSEEKTNELIFDGDELPKIGSEEKIHISIIDPVPDDPAETNDSKDEFSDLEVLDDDTANIQDDFIQEIDDSGNTTKESKKANSSIHIQPDELAEDFRAENNSELTDHRKISSEDKDQLISEKRMNSDTIKLNRNSEINIDDEVIANIIMKTVESVMPSVIDEVNQTVRKSISSNFTEITNDQSFEETAFSELKFNDIFDSLKQLKGQIDKLSSTITNEMIPAISDIESSISQLKSETDFNDDSKNNTQNDQISYLLKTAERIEAMIQSVSVKLNEDQVLNDENIERVEQNSFAPVKIKINNLGDFKVGDIVYHNVLGSGIIKSVGLFNVKIEFSQSSKSSKISKKDIDNLTVYRFEK